MLGIIKKEKPILIIFLLIAIFFTLFSSRYTFGFNSAKSNCLYTGFFLVDTWDKDIKPGDLAAFYMNKENKFYPVGMQWVKRVTAKGGDHVVIQKDTTTINDTTVIHHSLDYVLQHGEFTMDDVISQITIPDNEFFLMGETPTTFDSRFWGTVKREEIIGKAYAIL
jgi:conjugal transfer pilin signal peptidase TrbI